MGSSVPALHKFPLSFLGDQIKGSIFKTACVFKDHIVSLGVKQEMP